MAKIRIQQKSSETLAKILFITLCVIVAVGACIMLIALPNEKVSSKISASDQNKDAEEAQNGEVQLNDENIPFDVKAGGNFVVHVVLVDFADLQEFDTPEAVAEIDKLFNEQVFNDFTSLSEYYSESSKGKLNIAANISYIKLDSNYYDVSAHPMEYDFEKAIFTKGIKEGELKVFKGQYNAGIIIYAGLAYLHMASHPHTYMNVGLMALASSLAETVTVCHETGHLLDLYDLYTGTGYNAVSTYELMGTSDFRILSPINAYHRSTLNWLTESDYEDDISSEIEQITNSGTYKLMPCTSGQGVVAYKVAESEDETEAFYIEYRKATGMGICNQLPYGEQGGLFVYRVNKNCQYGNLNAVSHSNCEIFPFAPSLLGNGSKLFLEGSSIGKVGSGISLVYADGTKAFVNISNIKISDDGLTFDVDFAKTEVNEYYGSVFSSDTYRMLGDVDIYVNGQKVATSDENGLFTIAARKGDKVKFVADYYETYEMTLSDCLILEIDLSLTKIQVKINSGYSNYNLNFYENEKLVAVSVSAQKTNSFNYAVNLNKEVKYKVVYVRGDFSQTFNLNVTKNGQEFVMNVDPYVDESTVVRTYSGTLESVYNTLIGDASIYVNKKMVGTTNAQGAFSFKGMKNDVVQFIKNGYTLATKTLGTETSLHIVSEYASITINITSNKENFTVRIYEDGALIYNQTANGKALTFEGFIKPLQTHKYKVVYTREDYSEIFDFDMTSSNPTKTISVKESEKTILDQIGDGFDYFIYNMGKGFEELGRVLHPFNWF